MKSGPPASNGGSSSDPSGNIVQRVAESEGSAQTQFFERGRRRVAHPAAWPWRWIFPLFTLGCAVAIPFLSSVAADAVLDGNLGEKIQAITDPSAPGYSAFVAPTRTHLVIHVDDSDELVGASLLTQRGEELGGGTIVGIPAEFLGAAPGTSGGEPLVDSYETGKAERVVDALSRSLGTRPATYEVLTPSLWATLISPVEGFEFSLRDDLSFVSASGAPMQVSKGVVEVGAGELLVLSSASGNQPGIARAQNIERLWGGWMSAIQTSGLGDDAVGGGSEVLKDFVLGLTSGTVSQQPLPTSPFRVDGQSQPLYIGDDEAIAEMRRLLVPHVKPFEAGAVTTVQLINGTGDLTINQPAIDLIIENDALVQAIANAQSFDVVRSRIDYYDAADLEFVEALAEALGGADTKFYDTEDQGNDVVVTLGSDYRPRE